jgi:hypothetical protein
MREEILSYHSAGMSPQDIANLMEISVAQVSMVLNINPPGDAPAFTDTFGAIQTLRNAGFAVVAFSPEELRGINPTKVEDKLALIGSDVIDYFIGHSQE